jgi:hypothetical protein
MTHDQLVGTWRCRQNDSLYELRPDGTGLLRSITRKGRAAQERFQWSCADSKHLHLGLFSDPAPHVASLEDETIQYNDYEVVAEDASTISLEELGADMAWIWERMTPRNA